MAFWNAAGSEAGRVFPSPSAHSSMLKPQTWEQDTFHSVRKNTAHRYMPIGPTGRIIASSTPSSRAVRIVCAISCPILMSKSAIVAHGTGRKPGFQCGCRSSTVSGGCDAHASIRAKSHPAG